MTTKFPITNLPKRRYDVELLEWLFIKKKLIQIDLKNNS